MPSSPTSISGRRGFWRYLYGSHGWVPVVDADWSRGMIRDAPRAAIPANGVYDSADFLLHQPGIAIKRGGTAYAGPALTSSTYGAAAAYAEYPAGSQIVGIGDGGHLYKVTSGTTTDVNSMGSAYVPVDTPKLRIGGGKNLLVITANDGTSAPKTYDGTSVAALGGTPPAAKFAAIYKTRLVLSGKSGNENRLYFSQTPDIESTWDTTNSWIDCDFPTSGLASLSNALIIFSRGHTERIVGTTPPPGSDMDRAMIGSIGCTDARSIVVQENNVLFANPRGVYLTNGAGFASLTTEGQIETYWQSLFSSYDPATWIVSAGILRSFYFVSVIDNSGTLKATLMCNVPRRAWWRLTNIKATMFAQAVGVQDELYYADRSTNRVVAMSGIFSPASGNKNDANGTAVTPMLETRARGGGPGLKAFGDVHVSYDMRDAASDIPTLAVQYAKGAEATTYAACGSSPLAATSDEIRSRVTTGVDSQTLSLKFTQTNASSKTELYAIEADERSYPLAHEGK